MIPIPHIIMNNYQIAPQDPYYPPPGINKTLSLYLNSSTFQSNLCFFNFNLHYTGYAPPYPPPQGYPPPGYPSAPPQPPPGYSPYPPPPQYEGYQGYFNQGYPPPPPPNYHCHHVQHDNPGFTSFFQGWYIFLLPFF